MSLVLPDLEQRERELADADIPFSVAKVDGATGSSIGKLTGEPA